MQDPHAIRQADAAVLAAALADGRARTLAQFGDLQRALPGLAVPVDTRVNPPLWELGHLGWFEERWIARNAERARGVACDPDAPLGASLLDGADRLYDSSRVPHDTRWALPLPDADATLAYLAGVRQGTLALLRQSGLDDAALYAFRLVLFHEDMHREASHMTHQQLDIAVAPAPAPRAAEVEGEWRVPGGRRRVGVDARAAGFAFDNELGAHEVVLAPFGIDRAALSWRRYLEFVDAGGYLDARCWSDAGWAWRLAVDLRGPRHAVRTPAGWQQRRCGRWQPLELDRPAVHLSAHEAEAWCRWAGRRLPTEFEWEHAALLAAEQGEPFHRGEVWEWTASDFTPYPGFVPHPYRDYSRPWFGPGHRVLRGGSSAAEPRLRHPRYRNFFAPERTDAFAGLRSVALD